jgi:PEGA domain-containing protein
MAETVIRDTRPGSEGDTSRAGRRIADLLRISMPPCPGASPLICRHELQRPVLVLLALALVTQAGCVSRRLMVQSNPPGAMVLLEGKEVGYTPTGVDFTYYGTRALTLIKDGYETKTQLVPVRAPWYQWPVIEFFSDNFLLGRITDRHSAQFDLEPKRMVPNQELLNRGQILRNEAQIGQ